MDFRNKVVFQIDFFGRDVWITESIRNTWYIMGFLTILAIIVRLSLPNFKSTPKGFQNIVEIIVESMDNFVVGAMGEKYSYFGNWFFTVFAFIWCSNLSGLLALRPPTASLGTTMALALSSFVLIHFMGIFTGGLSYFKGYIEPFPMMLPLNLIGEMATPISLGFRLFGNILGGVIIMGMVYNLFPLILKLGVPSVLHIYFDVFSGSLQAFIFSILSMTFLRDKIAD